MTSTGLVLVVLVFLFVSAAFGVAARLASGETMEPATAFGWGSALGPIGLVVVVAVRLHISHRSRQRSGAPLF